MNLYSIILYKAHGGHQGNSLFKDEGRSVLSLGLCNNYR